MTTVPRHNPDLASALNEMAEIVRSLEPSGMAEESASWQERKSARTRVALLEAAVDCLAEVGYARTTTQLVAARAKISRGAMLHHYTTKSALIENVIDYVVFKRMKTFYSAIAALSEEDRVARNKGVEIYWSSLQTPEYEAFFELNVASRTDAELRAVFEPKALAFDKLWFAQLPTFFPEWAGMPEKLSVARDFVVTVLEGLWLNRQIMSERSRRIAVRELLVKVLADLREGGPGRVQISHSTQTG